MEISGIGGYRDGMAARSSLTSASSAFADSGPLLEKPPAARSVGAGVFYEEERGGGGRRLTAGGHRASEPIMLDFDLPSATATQTKQWAQKQQQKRAEDSLASSSSDSKRKNVPRLDNLQPSVNMSDERRDEYKQVLEDRIAHSLLRSQAAWEGTSGIFEDDPKNWKLHVSKPNLTMYRRRIGSGSDESISTSRRFIATGRIPGVTLQDLEYGLYADTTPDERAVNAYWFSDYFLDAAVLETYETRTNDDPFALFGVKWLLTGPFTHVKLVAPRDTAYMQYQKTVINEYGEKLLVRIVDTLPEDIVPHIPDQGDIHFVRMEFAIIYIYRYDPKAKNVQVFSEGRLDPAGRSTGWMANVNLTMFAPAIVNLENIADAKYMTKHGLMFPHETSPTGKSTMALSVSTHLPSPMASSVDQRMSHLTPSWVPDKKRKLCFVCFKSFSLLRGRHRHHCRMCGEVMCAECMVTLPLITPPKFDARQDANFPLQNQPEKKKLEDSHRHGFSVVNQFKLCKKCLLGIRQERRAMVAGVGNYYFAEGMIHHYARMQAAFAEFDDDAIESGYLDSSL
ncbi:1-phosphatidylinositol 3-phosphate 5-kinase, partial [Globisporangium polare]